MKNNDPTIVISWYEEIEARAIEFRRYVPPSGQNDKTWSPYLASIIVEASSIVDSVFRRLFNPKQRVHGKKKRRTALTINDFCALYKSKYDLEKRRPILLTSPPQYRAPFNNWTEHQVPEWWAVHTKLKHDRIKHMRMATWGSAINALAAALIAVAFLPKSTAAMMNRDWLDFDADPQQIEKMSHGGWKEGRGVSVHTKLFALILSGTDLPEEICDLQPHRYGRSPRLVNALARR
ncbi:MAG: hypothetical protein KIT40_15940 [Nitrospira sp.]|nr:hypothetical protein [Nitrospira sp.]